MSPLSKDDATSRLLAAGFWKGYRLRGTTVTVCKDYDGRVTVLQGDRELSVRLLVEGEAPLAVEEDKSVRFRVDQAKARQQSRPVWKPPPDHPWRRAFKTGGHAVVR